METITNGTSSMINKFITNLQVYNSNFNVKYKKDSLLMKIIGKILFFNKDFNNKFATTINQTTYLPNKEFLENKELELTVLIAHEYVHATDAKNIGFILYSLIYLSPLWVCLLTIPLYFVMGFWSLLFLIFLGPIPSVGRMWAEFRGYSMTLFLVHEILKKNHRVDTDYTVDGLSKKIQAEYFHSGAYYWMWPFNMNKKFDDVIKKIKSGDIYKESKAYQEVLDAFNDSSI